MDDLRNPPSVFSKADPRVLKNMATTIGNVLDMEWESSSLLKRNRCFINVDFPEPGLPLIRKMPSPDYIHLEKISLVRTQVKVPGQAVAMIFFASIMVRKRQPIDAS